MKNNEVLKLEWDRGFINYSDNVPVEALIKAGWRRATEPELKLEKIKQDLDQRIADTKKELKEIHPENVLSIISVGLPLLSMT